MIISSYLFLKKYFSSSTCRCRCPPSWFPTPCPPSRPAPRISRRPTPSLRPRHRPRRPPAPWPRAATCGAAPPSRHCGGRHSNTRPPCSDRRCGERRLFNAWDDCWEMRHKKGLHTASGCSVCASYWGHDVAIAAEGTPCLSRLMLGVVYRGF